MGLPAQTRGFPLARFYTPPIRNDLTPAHLYRPRADIPDAYHDVRYGSKGLPPRLTIR